MACRLNHQPRRLTNGYPIIRLHGWHFIITLNLSDRRYSNSDHAAPAQLYRGNLPYYHWLGRRVPSVKTPRIRPQKGFPSLAPDPRNPVGIVWIGKKPAPELRRGLVNPDCNT